MWHQRCESPQPAQWGYRDFVVSEGTLHGTGSDRGTGHRHPCSCCPMPHGSRPWHCQVENFIPACPVGSWKSSGCKIGLTLAKQIFI